MLYALRKDVLCPQSKRESADFRALDHAWFIWNTYHADIKKPNTVKTF